MRNTRHVFFLSAALALAIGLSGCGRHGSPLAWWSSLNHKAEGLATLEARYEALAAEHAALRREHLRLESEYSELKARNQTEAVAVESLRATGSATGRSPASIHYEVPRGLSPAQLEDLAYEHFREGRFAEAAVSFDEFLARPEAVSLHDATDQYNAGVAWFQVGNLRKARELLVEAAEHGVGEEKEKVRKKVELWQRVIDRRLAETGESAKIEKTAAKTAAKTVAKTPAKLDARAPASLPKEPAKELPTETKGGHEDAHHH